MVWSETIFVMILTHDKWKSFTDRPIADRGSSEVSLALALGSKEAVDAMVEAAAAAGGTADVNPVQDHGFMYGRDILDPDGHVWGPFWKIGRASCREKVCQYGEHSVVAGKLKKKKK